MYETCQYCVHSTVHKKLFVMPAYHYGVDVTLMSGEGLNTVGTSDVPQLKTFLK